MYGWQKGGSQVSWSSALCLAKYAISKTWNQKFLISAWQRRLPQPWHRPMPRILAATVTTRHSRTIWWGYGVLCPNYIDIGRNFSMFVTTLNSGSDGGQSWFSCSDGSSVFSRGNRHTAGPAPDKFGLHCSNCSYTSSYRQRLDCLIMECYVETSSSLSNILIIITNNLMKKSKS